MGATLIFLSKFNYLTYTLKVPYQRILWHGWEFSRSPALGALQTLESLRISSFTYARANPASASILTAQMQPKARRPGRAKEHGE